MSEFKGATRRSDVDTTKASARLPGLDIDIIHRRSPDGEAEQISINLQAVPSFEVFCRLARRKRNTPRYCAVGGSYSSTKVGAIRCQM